MYAVHINFILGCGKCWAIDGNWKLCFPHCMFPVVCKVPNLPLLKFPSVCTSQPKSKSAFCVAHYSKAEQLGYPTDVKGFLRFCGAQKTAGKYIILWPMALHACMHAVYIHKYCVHIMLTKQRICYLRMHLLKVMTALDLYRSTLLMLTVTKWLYMLTKSVKDSYVRQNGWRV